MDARAKTDFRRQLIRDFDDLDDFDVPAAPLHLSNSTDAFQEGLEDRFGDALFTLQQVARRRRRFTTITILTKNPGRLLRPAYLQALQALHRPNAPVAVEVSLAFWRERIAAIYDPGAPCVAERLEAVRQLRAAGLPVVLRVSPTYPIAVGCEPDTGSTCPQPPEDMDRLIAFAAEAGVGKVVYTPAKIVRPKHGDMHPLMRSMLRLYRRLSGSERLPFRGGSWRLPWPAVELHVSAPLARICRRHGVGLDFCKNHLLGTT